MAQSTEPIIKWKAVLISQYFSLLCFTFFLVCFIAKVVGVACPIPILLVESGRVNYVDLKVFLTVFCQPVRRRIGYAQTRLLTLRGSVSLFRWAGDAIRSRSVRLKPLSPMSCCMSCTIYRYTIIRWLCQLSFQIVSRYLLTCYDIVWVHPHSSTLRFWYS